MTITARILSVTSEGPAFTGEVAAEVGITSSTAAAMLRSLERRGHVSRTLVRIQREGPGRRVVSLWSGIVPEQGEGDRG